MKKAKKLKLITAWEGIIDDILCSIEELAFRTANEIGTDTAQVIINRIAKARERIAKVRITEVG